MGKLLRAHSDLWAGVLLMEGVRRLLEDFLLRDVPGVFSLRAVLCVHIRGLWSPWIMAHLAAEMRLEPSQESRGESRGGSPLGSLGRQGAAGAGWVCFSARHHRPSPRASRSCSRAQGWLLRGLTRWFLHTPPSERAFQKLPSASCGDPGRRPGGPP